MLKLNITFAGVQISHPCVWWGAYPGCPAIALYTLQFSAEVPCKAGAKLWAAAPAGIMCPQGQGNAVFVVLIWSSMVDIFWYYIFLGFPYFDVLTFHWMMVVMAYGCFWPYWPWPISRYCTWRPLHGRSLLGHLAHPVEAAGDMFVCTKMPYIYI